MQKHSDHEQEKTFAHFRTVSGLQNLVHHFNANLQIKFAFPKHVPWCVVCYYGQAQLPVGQESYYVRLSICANRWMVGRLCFVQDQLLCCGLGRPPCARRLADRTEGNVAGDCVEFVECTVRSV